MGHHLPFGPSLAIGAWIVYLWHEEIHQFIENLVMGPM